MSQTIFTDYRRTINLPRTTFPMQGELKKREPERVAWWREHGVYERRLQRNAANAPWILHDGPPYANGEVHMGTFLNRVAKDIFVKVHLLEGRYAKFVPGWDMHGLPIEFETLKHLGLDFHKIDPIELRAKCRERALYWLDRQRATFLRMGLLGDYDHPYRTIDPAFEAEIVETLADLAQAQQLYKGLRATLWCIHDETALAEAEIEYKPRTSPSVYVRFTADALQRPQLLRRFGIEDDSRAPERVSIVIWTTTPWTLPANAAIAVKRDAAYSLYRIGDEAIVVADDLYASVVARAPDLIEKIADGEEEKLATVAGLALIGGSVRHPFLDRNSTIVGADYVELDSGTGAVHTAPGHGVDDFETGQRYGLPIISPVDGSGHFTAEAGAYAGMQIFDANARITSDLRESGQLLASEEYLHSYPHCWRCKNPVIFRATPQWFISLDVNDLRKKAEAVLDRVQWTPEWGRARMGQMVQNHPEWCISRQRTWGTPIPAVRCTACNASVLDPVVARKVAARFREAGGDAWWSDDIATFLPPGFACPSCRETTFEKEFNIVDIWFESGVTHRVVLGQNGMPWPADAVLEGADQFRGWFRSSLLTAVATKGAPPYKAVVSTGWVVDAEGHAMHKSAGNYIAAQSAMETYGADVLRLWCASVEFTADMRLGDELIKAVGGVYRNWRYRLRMLLGLIEDLTPERMLPLDELEPLDRAALARTAELGRVVTKAYREFRLHDVYVALQDFDADLSGFYIEALRDRAYSSAPDEARRRSVQTALFSILEQLLALYAPILSFTAEEAWQNVPAALRRETQSVFDLQMPAPPVRSVADDEALATWAMLKRLRAIVAVNDDTFRFAAKVYARPDVAAQLAKLRDNLREALVVSQLELVPDADHTAGEPLVVLSAAEGQKCSRCWKYLPPGGDDLHPTLCAACAPIVRAYDIAHPPAPPRAAEDEDDDDAA